MIVLKLNYKKLLACVLTIALVSCANPWEDRQDNGDANLSVSLDEAITNTAEVSQFGALLAQTGYDKILAASKTYTVFAPTNEAIAQLDPSILNDPEALSFYVSNHIALTAYSSVRDADKVKIKMLSGKYLEFKGTALISDANIVTADHYAANGVFHVINKALVPKSNIWEYIKDQAGSSKMSDYLLSLNELSIYASDDVAKVNAVPGALADSLSNSFLKNVYNLNNEKNSYTLFLMEDDGYTAEVDKLKPYLIKSNADSTARYASYFTLRDMVFPKAYQRNELPELLTSRFGVNVAIDQTEIVGEPIVLSNGIVYRVRRVNVSLANRLVTTKIEGENNYASSVRSKVFYRDKKYPSGPSGNYFKDIMVQNSAYTFFQLDYSAKDLYSTTYKVYWRAINDVQTTTFQQRLVVGLVKRDNILYFNESIKDFLPKNVPFGDYNEVYLGEFTLTNARDIDKISLVGANSTANGVNTMSLDYLKFVPVVK